MTGGTGYIGVPVVRLLSQWANVTVLSRDRRAAALALPFGVKIVQGDISDPVIVNKSTKGADLVVHMAAAIDGPPENHTKSTIDGTRNVVVSCVQQNVPKLLYMSSLSVLDLSHIQCGQSVDESWDYEPTPQKRGLYTRSKLEAEKIVLEESRHGKLETIVLRPAEVFSAKRPHLSPAVGMVKGNLLVHFVAQGANIPLVELDDLAAVICKIAKSWPAGPDIINVVEKTLVDSETYARIYQAIQGNRSFILIPVPTKPVVLLFKCLDGLLSTIGRPKSWLGYRLKAAVGPRIFSTRLVTDICGENWSGGVSRFFKHKELPSDEEGPR